jgi:hypothetical protein
MTDTVEPLAQPAPGWSNSTDTVPNPGFITPVVDMSVAGWSNAKAAATGATAGKPGAWTPAGRMPPQKFTQMDTITASPATAWTAGQYVTLGDGSEAHWGGAAWTSGIAP